MRFVVSKSEQAQAAGLVFRARDLLVKQRTQIINALRGHLAEFGIVAAKGPARVPQLMLAVEDPDEPIPELARPILQMLIETLRGLDKQIARLDHEIAQRAKENEAARFCRKLWLRTERCPSSMLLLMRRAAQTAQQATVADFWHTPPVPFASCAPSRCHSRSRERILST
jgi:transposase